MTDVEPPTPQPEHRGAALRLRLGVALILLWWAPLWLLAAPIAHHLAGSPAIATVTAVIVVVQTLLGVAGFWVAGAQVKQIVKGSTKRQALRSIWSIFVHGGDSSRFLMGGPSDPTRSAGPPEP